jgi:hypothetical protein
MVAKALIVGAVAGSIIATIMLTHMTNDDAAPAIVQVLPHHTCARMGLNAGRLVDWMMVTHHAATVVAASAA